MIAADTNLLVRIIVDDDPEQADAVRRWIRLYGHDGILVDHIVLVELAWVLRARYRHGRDAITRVLEALLDTAGLVVSEPELVRLALDGYASGRGDFADHLIRARTAAQGAAPLASFDKSLHGLPGFSRVSAARR